MNPTRTIALLESALFEASLADRGWKAAVLGPDGEVAGTGPDHVSAWNDMGTRYDMPDYDRDDDGNDEGFVDADGTFYTRAGALEAWRAEYHTSLRRKNIWTDRCPSHDPGDSCDLKLDLV